MSTDSLLIDDTEFQALATEIDGVLDRARELEPATQGVGVRPDHPPGTMIVGVEGTLAQLISDAFAGQQTVSSLVTGSEEFDTIVAELCLESATLDASVSAVFFQFSDLMNARTTMDAFIAIAGVSYAQPQPYGGDTSDIALEKIGPDWYVVFRDAFGDCPSGCIGQKLYYFTVSPTDARQWCEREALQDPILRRLAESWGAQRLPLDPAACESPAPSPDPISLPRTGGSP